MRSARRPLSRGARASIVIGVCAGAIACGSDEPTGTKPPPGASTGDLTIRYIERLPRLDYVEGSANPRVDGWPAVGALVTWRAHVKNWAPEPRSVGYRWLLDGVEVARASLSLAGDAEATADHPWTWTFDRHSLTFEVDPDARVEEELETNNALTVFTDALSLGIYVEQSMYDLIRSVQRANPGLQATSFEDWLHRHVAALNTMFENARYAETPNGVLDRVRLDRVTVAPDNSLQSPQLPNPTDGSVDLMWGFPVSMRASFEPTPTNPLPRSNDFLGAFLHELGHARYLIDVYAFQLLHGFMGSRVEITEGGQLAVNTGLMPGRRTTGSFNGGPRVDYFELFVTPEHGLMEYNYTFVDRYSAIALNLIAGHRATFGNSNCPVNCGAFMRHLPKENRLTVRDAAGALLPGASVRVYRGEHNPPQTGPGAANPYAKRIDDVPDLQLVADANGQVLLGMNPFDSALRDDRFLTTSIAVVRVAHQGKVGYAYLERRTFNLARWAGHVDLADHEIRVTLGTP